MVVELGYIGKNSNIVYFSLGDAKYIDTILYNTSFNIDDYKLVYVLKDDKESTDIICIADMEDKNVFLQHIDEIAYLRNSKLDVVIRIDAIYNTDDELKILYNHLVIFIDDIKSTSFVNDIIIHTEGCDIVGLEICKNIINTYWHNNI